MSWFRKPKVDPPIDPRKPVRTFEDLAAWAREADAHVFSTNYREPRQTQAVLLIIERIEAIEAKGAK